MRDSKHGGEDSPFTLTVYNNNKVFNINIRFRPDAKIALGKEKLEESVRTTENVIVIVLNFIENIIADLPLRGVHGRIPPARTSQADCGRQCHGTQQNYPQLLAKKDGIVNFTFQ